MYNKNKRLPFYKCSVDSKAPSYSRYRLSPRHHRVAGTAVLSLQGKKGQPEEVGGYRTRKQGTEYSLLSASPTWEYSCALVWGQGRERAGLVVLRKIHLTS